MDAAAAAANICRFRRCFSAHSRLACLDRSAASSRAFLAASSRCRRSLSRCSVYELSFS
ncbi:hypothetical protein ACRALDRAFT_1064834 [Sodiomyces alcalophilus JCM 7366]|uniref:uncharacterized protein n=1 Tax=Sodiomyces alcalophilus JCM 7366 TaxID=591952 RepID=UPI0039B63D0E